MVMRRIVAAAMLLALTAVLAACSGGGRTTPTPTADTYRGVPVFPKLNFPQMLVLQPIPGDQRHALLFTKDGIIRRADLSDPSANPTVFMDIRDKIIPNPELEEGLLGLAFAPDYPQSGKFYVFYTAGDPRRSVLARFVASGDHADPATEHVLLEIPKQDSNHNGGSLVFGPIDGELYVGIGDGGSEGDLQGNGQNLNTLFGKILRLDVSGDDYTIPIGNPFAHGGGRPEIWAYGLRNPWRMSADIQDGGRLMVGDVGQDKWEEVDVIDRGGDYGWNIMEGDHCYKPSTGCEETGLAPPLAEYGHDVGCAIIGGFVYHGAAIPELQGSYLYGDYCSGRVWALPRGGAPAVELANTGAAITSFGQDAQGEAYLVTFDKQILKLERK